MGLRAKGPTTANRARLYTQASSKGPTPRHLSDSRVVRHPTLSSPTLPRRQPHMPRVGRPIRSPTCPPSPRARSQVHPKGPHSLSRPTPRAQPRLRPSLVSLLTPSSRGLPASLYSRPAPRSQQCRSPSLAIHPRRAHSSSPHSSSNPRHPLNPLSNHQVTASIHRASLHPTPRILHSNSNHSSHLTNASLLHHSRRYPRTRSVPSLAPLPPTSPKVSRRTSACKASCPAYR